MHHDIAALKAQHADLAATIAAAELAHKASAIAQVKAVMAEHGLSLADVAGTPSAVKANHSSAGVKRGKVVCLDFSSNRAASWENTRQRKYDLETASLRGGFSPMKQSQNLKDCESLKIFDCFGVASQLLAMTFY